MMLTKLNFKRIFIISIIIVTLIAINTFILLLIKPVNRYNYNDITEFTISNEDDSVNIVAEIDKVDNQFDDYYKKISQLNDSNPYLSLNGEITDANTAVLIADIFLNKKKDNFDNTRDVEYDSIHKLWAIKYNKGPFQSDIAIVVINQKDGGIVWYMLPANF